MMFAPAGWKPINTHRQTHTHTYVHMHMCAHTHIHHRFKHPLFQTTCIHAFNGTSEHLGFGNRNFRPSGAPKLH